ncbi:Cell wall protein rhd3, partial [Cymbomonas tetramitiformis]
ALEQASSTGNLDGFGAHVHALIGRATELYDEETQFFDPAVRTTKREEMVQKVMRMWLPAFTHQMEVLREQCFATFQAALSEATSATSCNFMDAVSTAKDQSLGPFVSGSSEMLIPGSDWEDEVQRMRKELEKEIASLITQTRTKRMEAVLKASVKSLTDAVVPSVSTLMDDALPDMWPTLRNVMRTTMEGKRDSLGVALSSYSPEAGELAGMQETLVLEAREAVQARVLEASNSVVLRMRERFNQVFHKDENGLPRTWDVNVDIAGISKKGKLEAAQVLALFAVSMMDEPEDGAENATSTVCSTLAALAEPAQTQGDVSDTLWGWWPLRGCAWRAGGDTRDGTEPGDVIDTLWGWPLRDARGGPGDARDGAEPGDVSRESSGDSATLGRSLSLGSQFAMATWPGVDESVTLLSPARCRELWRSFDSEVMVYITQAVAAQVKPSL